MATPAPSRAALDVLQEEGEHEERAQGAEVHRGADGVGGGEGRATEQGGGEHRVRAPALDRHQGRQERGGRHAGRGRAGDDREGQRGQQRHRERGAGDVGCAGARLARLVHDACRDRQGDRDDREVDEEGPAPARAVDQGAAGDDPSRQRERRDRGPDADGARPLRRIRVRARDDRQRAGQQ
jgi:hypothetical protein